MDAESRMLRCRDVARVARVVRTLYHNINSYVDGSIKIAGEDDSSLSVSVSPRNVMEFTVLKQKMFAFAAPSMWQKWHGGKRAAGNVRLPARRGERQHWFRYRVDRHLVSESLHHGHRTCVLA